MLDGKRQNVTNHWRIKRPHRPEFPVRQPSPLPQQQPPPAPRGQAQRQFDEQQQNETHEQRDEQKMLLPKIYAFDEARAEPGRQPHQQRRPNGTGQCKIKREPPEFCVQQPGGEIRG